MGFELHTYEPQLTITIIVSYEDKKKDRSFTIQDCSCDKSDYIFKRIRDIHLKVAPYDWSLCHEASIVVDSSLLSVDMIDSTPERGVVSSYARSFLKEPITSPNKSIN